MTGRVMKSSWICNLCWRCIWRNCWQVRCGVRRKKGERRDSSQIKCDTKIFDLRNSWMEPHTDYQKAWGGGSKTIRSLPSDTFSDPLIFASLGRRKKSHILICISLTMSEMDHLHFLYCDPFILISWFGEAFSSWVVLFLFMCRDPFCKLSN